MDKLKKVFSPGNKGDDEVLYGSSGPEVPQVKDTGSGPYNAGVPQGPAAPTLYTDPKAEKKDHGILKQILNPDGSKYDEQKFGETASTQPPLGATTAGGATALHSKPEAEKDGGIARQILNPGGDKYDETRYGTTATSQRDLPDRSTGNVVSGMAASPSLASADNASTLSIKSGVSGPYASHTDDHHATGSTDNSHLDRDAGIAGAGLGAAAYGADRSMANTGKGNVQQPSSAERSFPLGGGTATADSNRPTSSVYSADTAANPPTSTTGTSKDYGTLGTAAVTATGTGQPHTTSGVNPNPVVPGWEEHGAQGHVHSFKGVPGESKPVEGYVHQTKGPHITDIANMLDPHVPGEFPSEDGTDRHNQSGLGGIGSGSATASAVPATSSTQQQSPLGGFGGASTTSTTGPSASSSSDHHYGRDAALAGGAGVAGLGAYEASQDRSAPTSSHLPSSTSQTVPATQHQHIGTDGPIGSSTLPSSSTQPQEHHYGRDAALAGGAGAAGLGAYEATKDRHGPTSSQPTALPDRSLPVTQREHIGTDGPIGSSGLPSSTTEPKQHHHGRDAAVAGGVGAAGVGAYELGKDRNVPTSAQTTSSAQPSSIGYPSVQDSQQRADNLMGAPVGTSTQAYPSTIPATSSAPTGQGHHYGRDAALAGGAGAAGLGAYEASKGRDETGPASKTIGPHSSNTANIVGPRVQPGQTTQPSGSLKTADPRAEHDLPRQQDKDHHYGRDAAIAGGAGAAGYGAYEATQGRGDTGPASKTVGPHSSNVANIVDPRVQPQPEKMKDHTTTGPYQSDTLNKADPRVTSDPAQAQEKEHHYGRDAAVAGGAGAAGYGAYEAIDKHEQEKQAKEAAKEQAKAEKQHQKELEHAEKEHKKEQEKAEKELKKEQEKAEKQHQKDLEHAEKERQKEEEKADKHHQKELAKEREKAEKQHEKELEKVEKAEHKQDEKLAAAQAKEQEKLDKAHEKELHKGHHNKLHKDPPEEKEKKPSLIHRIFHPHEKESELPEQNVQGSRAQGLEHKDADEARHIQNERELASGAPGERGYDSTLATGAAHGGVGSDGMVTEPHTGLPMNVGKYGSGAGGTDAAPQIPGYHETGSSSLGQGTTGASTSGADWEGIKKANTPY